MRRLVALLALVAMGVGLGSAPVSAAPSGDWPTTGYDNANTAYNSAESALPPAAVPRLHVAARSRAGRFPSAPVVAGGMVYASVVRGGSGGDRGYLVASRLTDGRPVFAVRLESAAVRPSPPTVVDGVAYVGTSWGVWALNATDGVVRWKARLPFATAPVVSAGKLYVIAAGALVALNAATGRALWRRADCVLEDHPVVGPGIRSVAGSVVYVIAGYGCLRSSLAVEAVDARTGELVSLAPLAGPRRSLDYEVSSVMVGPALVYEHTSDEVIAFDRATSAVRWTTPLSSPGSSWVGSMALGAGRVYVAKLNRDLTQESLVALDARTGRWLWQRTVAAPYDGSPPVGADGVVYLNTNSNGGALYAVDATTGAVLARRTHPLVLNAYGYTEPPTVADGTILALEGSAIVFYRASSR